MTSEIFDDTLIEIKRFIRDLEQIKKQVNENVMIDSYQILQRYEYCIENDSGFESETVQKADESGSFLFPACYLKEILFEAKEVDELYEYLFNNVWERVLLLDSERDKYQIEIESLLDFIIEFITFLKTSKNISFRNIVKENLENLLANAIEETEDNTFDFVMHIFVKLGSLEEIYGIVMDIIIQKVIIFAENLKLDKPDGSFGFKHETDFNRANMFLLTALIMKNENKNKFNLYYPSEEETCLILGVFSSIPDFYILEHTAVELLLS